MDPLATIMKNTLNVNTEEFQNFITQKILEPKEDVKSEMNMEMSTINYEDIMGTPSTSGYSVKRGHGGSSVPKTAVVEPPRRPRGHPPTTQMLANVDSYDMDNSSAISRSEQKEHRYQRRLQSNHAAFQRYQINRMRKLKLETQEAVLKKRKTEKVKTCPEVASTTSMVSSNSQIDPSILSFKLELLK